MTAPRDLAHVSTAELRQAVLIKGASIHVLDALDELARRAEAGGRAVADLAKLREAAEPFAWLNLRAATTKGKRLVEELLAESVVLREVMGIDAQPQTAAPPVERDALKAAAAGEARAVLVEVMSWIKNWSPSFTDDPEWSATAARVAAALAAPQGGAT